VRRLRTSTLQRLWHWVRHARERNAHPTNRKEALARLRLDSRPRSVLVVCHGNLCRSPFAAAILRRRLAESNLQVSVASAGYLNSTSQGSPAEAIEAAAAHGIDLSTHRSQLINRALLESADLVVVMDAALSRAVVARGKTTFRVLVLGDLDPLPIETREIIDPFGAARAAFDRCYARIDRCVAELARTLAGRDAS